MNAIEKWMKKVNFLEPHVNFVDPPKLFYPPPFYLFRGESRKWDFPMSNRWSRRNIADESKERKYYEQCFIKLYGYNKPFNSDLNLRFVAFLQHYGFDTRLIDVASKPDTALYFAINEHPNEDGFVHKILGYDILAVANNLDQADIDSVFFNQDFPPTNHAITKQYPRTHLFYRDTNSYNFNAIRQEAWFIFQTKNYKGHPFSIKAYPVTPEDKHELMIEFKNQNLDHNFYFPDIKQIATSLK